MDSDLIQRYQPGGDIYLSLVGSIGTAGANSVAEAALSGDETQVNAAITQAEYGNPLTTSTASIFGAEIVTDPLAAPLDDVNTAITNSLAAIENSLKNTLSGVVTNPLVLISTIAIIGGVVVYFVGFDRVKKLLK